MIQLRAAIIGVVVSAAFAANGIPAHAATVRTDRVVASDLVDVAAVPGTDQFFAVGGSQTSSATDPFPPLFLHGRPGHWSGVASHLPANSQLEAVAAPTSRTVWAVGDYFNPNGSDTLPLVVHLTSTGFRQQAAPEIVGGFLRAVSATSSRNAWAVGWVDAGTGRRPLALHWSGGAWHRVALHLPPRIESLTSISMTSPSNGWMVGSYYRDPFDSTSLHSVLLHWNGQSWSLATIPSAAGVVSLTVSAVSGRRALAVGTLRYTSAYLLSWNGLRWTRSHLAVAGTPDDVVMRGSQGWAVGSVITTRRTPLILRWTGTTWRTVTAVGRGNLSSLVAVAAGTLNHPVAVGSSTTSAGTDHAMAEDYRSGRWSLCVTPESSPQT